MVLLLNILVFNKKSIVKFRSGGVFLDFNRILRSRRPDKYHPPWLTIISILPSQRG